MPLEHTPKKDTRSSCLMCVEPDDNDMVQCDACDEWTHFTCAGVGSSVAKRRFLCKACAVKRQSSKTSVDTEFELKRLSELHEAEIRRIDQKYSMLRSSVGGSRAGSEANRNITSNSKPLNIQEWVNASRAGSNVQKQPGLQHEDVRVRPATLTLPGSPESESKMPIRCFAPDFNGQRNHGESNTTVDMKQLFTRQLVRDLPTFSGKPEEWPMFIGSYKESTKACGFSNVENMLRLQRALKGKALDAVKCRLINPAHTPDVIRTLNMLFGSPEAVINSILQHIRSELQPRVEKLDSIIKFALAVQNLHATMETAGLDAHLNNPILVQELVGKLPPHLKLDWARYAQVNITSGPNITHFNSWLMQLAEAANSVSWASPSANTTSAYTAKPAPMHAHTEVNGATGTTIKCHLCSGGHKLEDCARFGEMTVPSRWDALKSNRLCRRCLGLHNFYNCRSKRLCRKDGCERKHHPLLHNNVRPAATEDVSLSHATTSQIQHNTKILFRIVPVNLYHSNKIVSTFAFLDDGSSVSLIEESLARELHAEGPQDPLCLRWTGETTRLEKLSRRVSISISGNGTSAKRYGVSLRTVDKLNLPKQTVAKVDSHMYPHLRHLPLQTYNDATPRILIGLDNWHVGLPLKYKEGERNHPVATKTRLGWVLQGRCEECDPPLQAVLPSYHICHCEIEEDVHKQVQDFFTLENLGVRVSANPVESKEDRRARGMLEALTVRSGKRYTTGLLWKEDSIQLPDSFAMAKRRLECLERKIKSNPELCNNLKDQIRSYVSKGYARIMKPHELKIAYPRTWYLPMFAVVNPNKPGKVRMVFDAAAKVEGKSLNDMLLKGPDQLTLLPGVLQRFRERAVAICGDIREMFHQVEIRAEDRHSQRFLWRDGDDKRAADVYMMNVMTFGATCSPSAAQYVKNINAKHFDRQYPRAVRAICENHYVDDMLDCTDTVDEAIQLAKEVRHIHQQGGFHITKWVSNSYVVMEALGEPNRSEDKDLQLNSEIITTKVLGLRWRSREDAFVFSMGHCETIVSTLAQKHRPTKRQVLRVIMSIFDPLGFLASFLVYGKILLQDVWRSGIGWDSELQEDEYRKWLNWTKQFGQIECVRIPRYILIGSKSDNGIQMHLFVDASECAYAAVAYARFVTVDKGFKCTFLAAKTKVAPLKPLSIPRMELQAALLGARLAQSIAESHSFNFKERFFWTDSRNVLSWLKADARRYKQFVAHRIGEIHESSQPDEWRWVPTKLNVADEATKWVGAPDISENSRWFNGPDFLQLPEKDWPTVEVSLPPKEDNEFRMCHHVDERQTSVAAVGIDLERFSSWTRLLNATCYMYRAVESFRALIKKEAVSHNAITAEERRRSENLLFRIAQIDDFGDEVSALAKSKTVHRGSSLFSLSPYMDDEKVIRLKGRIDAVDAELEVKRPVILPKRHRVTLLIMTDFHIRFNHQNNETVINEFRQKYWTPSARTLLKRIKRECNKCKILRAAPEAPEMSDLPPARLASFTRPFTYVGLDFFGPMTVAVGRRTEKRWGVIFTCLTVRAVHLEIAHSLSTDSCILSLRNFQSRRGTPAQIYCDNGTNFHGAERALAEEWRKITWEKANIPTEWVFNPPASPHMGGAWERLIRSVKRGLQAMLPARNPSDELLRSVFAEVENMVNSRPLTYIPIEAFEREALTPNHFLLGTSNGTKNAGEFTDDGLILRSNWKKAQILADHFWRRWMKEYLPTLTRRTRWFGKVKPIEVGDIVIVVDPANPRNTWPMGKILRTIRGSGGQVRQAEVQTQNGTLRRPATRLAVLDVRK